MGDIFKGMIVATPSFRDAWMHQGIHIAPAPLGFGILIMLSPLGDASEIVSHPTIPTVKQLYLRFRYSLPQFAPSVIAMATEYPEKRVLPATRCVISNLRHVMRHDVSRKILQ